MVKKVMKQYNILGGVDNLLKEDHPQIENKKINENYYGSSLNRLGAESCRKDIVINNIDMIVNNYKDDKLKIIESKHSNEKLSKGQDLLLQKLSNIGIRCYVVYGNYPYNTANIYSYQSKKTKTVNKQELIDFIDNY